MQPGFGLNGLIAVKTDSPIKSMADLRGQKFAFGDAKALLQPAVVIASGLKLEEFAAWLRRYPAGSDLPEPCVLSLLAMEPRR